MFGSVYVIIFITIVCFPKVQGFTHLHYQSSISARNTNYLKCQRERRVSTYWYSNSRCYWYLNEEQTPHTILKTISSCHSDSEKSWSHHFFVYPVHSKTSLNNVIFKQLGYHITYLKQKLKPCITIVVYLSWAHNSNAGNINNHAICWVY